MIGLNKLALGAGAAMLIAIVILFNLLMSSNEARGALQAEVDEAVRANAANVELIDQLEADNERIQADFDAERARADQFTAAVTASQQELERAKNDFRRQLRDVRAELTVEERACADSPIPDAYFDQLRERPGGSDTG